ncbi:cupin domain-containing protein [Tahibacter amnicola]|uniref:Cupin domain-containing protein n=1 Tax=Tahibacter amnicola TaxID=2976241 RepID=A0ABY6B919_9GAMM|nr:cupin domain-containing protein [Tahibacter amnicola]UXI66558.1 cupin domain-containing protein [Tahibacter amnicola]
MSEQASGNFFGDALPPRSGERFDVLLRHRNLVVERIVSSGVVTPTPYVQTQDEWVVLLRGEATLLIDDRVVELTVGDYVFLPASTPHTVQRVSADALWLAVHLHPDDDARIGSTQA